MERVAITPELLRQVAATCARALRPHAERDWTAQAGDLDWDCEETLRHATSALAFYSSHLAMRSRGPFPFQHVEEPGLRISDLLVCLEVRAGILAEVGRAAGPEARGWHAMGVADAEGSLAMGCSELLIHTDDIATSLDVDFHIEDQLVAPVLARLFPWAPDDAEPWPAFRWANGRTMLGDRPRLQPDWALWCAPLAEWDGVARTGSVREPEENSPGLPPAWSAARRPHRDD